MTPRSPRMTACVTAMAVAVVVMDAVEAFSHTTSIGFSSSTPGIQYYDEGGNALFINEAFPLVSGRLLQICFYIHKNFDINYTGTFFVFKKIERGYRLTFQQNVVFPRSQGRHCVNMTEPPLVINGQFVGWRYDQDAGPISYTIPDQESGTMVVNNVTGPLMVGQTYSSRSFTKTYYFMVEAVVDIGVLGTIGQTERTGYSGLRVVPGVMGVAEVVREDGRNGTAGTPRQKNVEDTPGTKSLPGLTRPQDHSRNSGQTNAASVVVSTGPVGDTAATGPVGHTAVTGPSGDDVVTGPPGDSSERITGYNFGAQGRNGSVYFLGKRVNLSDPEDLKLIKKQITMHCCEDGAPGITGSTGVTGLRGAAGYTGLTGLSGSKGDSGVPGVTGSSGQDGLMGATGPVGASGPPGVSGITGLTGQRGPIGITGVSGSHGSTGPVGPAAVTGRTGSTGPVGETGVSGMPGLSGAHGDAGATGITGLRGEAGATGPKGELFKYPDKCNMTPSPCEQICVNIGISYECRCREGYTLAADKSRCVDVNECITGGPCEQLCENTVGSFRCSCRPGFNLTENQRNCEDFDECKHNVCPHPSFRVARICKNTIGSFICIGFGTFLSDLDKEHDNAIHYDFQYDGPPHETSETSETPATLRNLVRTTNVLTILVGCLLGVVLIIVIAVILLACKARRSSRRSPSVYRLHPEMYGSRGNLSPRSDAECGVGNERTYIQQPYPGMTL